MNKTTPLTYTSAQLDLLLEYEEYLLQWVDCGDEPMTFEEFQAEA